MSSRESLAAALDNLLVIGNEHTYQAVLVMREAARERLTQLECGALVINKEWTGFAEPQWPARTVERIAKALQDLSLYSQDPVTGGIAGFDPQRVAVAVLDALNGEPAS